MRNNLPLSGAGRANIQSDRKQMSDNPIAGEPVHFFVFKRSFISSLVTECRYISQPNLQKINRSLLPLRRRESESSMTLFPEAANRDAISRAASNLRKDRKPLFVRIASPINSALLASPCARTMIDWKVHNQNTHRITILFKLTCFSWIA